MPVKYGSLPFKEQIAFFRDKVRMPTAAWTDLWEGMHARAFSVAGAMKDELLTDLQEAVGKAIEQGTTLAEFRKDFDQIVQRHGWPYKGGRGWRTRVIYETNLRTSYQAGRYQQMQAIKKTRPYWRYRHNDAVEHPRPEHQAWDGLVLDADDPFWNTHYPPNGWGCKCYVETLSKRDLTRLHKDGPDQAPPLDLQEKTVGIRGPSPRTVKTPRGIDPGWGYNVGRAATGQTLSGQVMDQWRQTRNAWRPLAPAGWAEAGQPKTLPMVKPPVKLIEKLKDQAQVVSALEKVLGGESKLYKPGGLPVQIHAGVLGKHIELSRTEYLPLLDDLMSDPYETWVGFEQHHGTGKVVLRSRIIKGYDLGKGKILLMIANARKGQLEGWTMIPTSDMKYVNRQRRGILIKGKE